MNPPKAVILGTGRSGSGFIAAALNAAGLNCGHENWWNPLNEQIDGLDIDSSWCALKDAHEIPASNRFLQVRHPLKTIASLTAFPDWGPYHALRDETLPGLPDTKGIDRATEITVRWLETALACTPARNVWRLEQLNDPGVMHRVVTSVRDAAAPTKTVRPDGASETPSNVNSHQTRLVVGWGDIPRRHRAHLRALTQTLGYTT